jgi:ABC-type amino acid transport system permease subunit
MVPALINANVTLLKDASLAYVVAYEELLRRGRIVVSSPTTRFRR